MPPINSWRFYVAPWQSKQTQKRRNQSEKWKAIKDPSKPHHKWKSLMVLIVMFGSGRPMVDASSMLPPLMTSFTNSDIRNHLVVMEDSFRSNTYVLKCPGSENSSYKWFKNDAPVAEEGLVVSGDGGQQLSFEPNFDHEGYYHCVATNQFGMAKSEVIRFSDKAPEQPDLAAAPVFSVQPEVGVIEAGSQTAFKCDAEGHPTPDIIWTKNGQVLSAYKDLEKLSIERVETSDIGTYACNATNSVGYVYKVVYLTILNQAPEFTETPDNRTVSVGQQAILRCNAKGYPKPTITWEYGSDENENYEITEDFDLKISRVKAGDEGTFTCKISNELGTKSFGGYLKVVSTTTIVNGPADTKEEIHKSVKLPCDVIWDPKYELTVIWKKNNLDIAADGARTIQDVSDHSLLIKDLTFEDSGVYTCVASTSTTGTVTDSGTLHVTGKPPVLVRGPASTTVATGVAVEIFCTVKGYPKPHQTWYKDGDVISFNAANVSPSNQLVSVDGEGTLRIAVASLDDAGEYRCRAENDYGLPVVATALIQVRNRTEVLKAPEDVVFQLGGEHTFDCLVKVDENNEESLVTEWLKDGRRLDLGGSSPESDTSRMILHPNNSLTIKQAVDTDVGTYTCKVETDVDGVTLSATLYHEFGWLWLIVLIAVIIILLVLTLCLLGTAYAKQRSGKKGSYGVKDVEDGKESKKIDSSDIQYSIDDDEETVRKPLSQKASGKHASRVVPPSQKSLLKRNCGRPDGCGSGHSLLDLSDEDEWLRTGMEEDGSFRGNYMK